MVFLLIGAFVSFDLDTKYISNFGIKQLPKEHESLVGVWRSHDSVIEINSFGKWLSRVQAGSVRKTTNATIQSIAPNKIRVGFSAFGNEFNFRNFPEQQDNGKWTWEVNGEIYEKTGDRLPASERDEITGAKKRREKRMRKRQSSRRNH